MPDTVVSIQGLCRQFGTKTALQNVNLSIPRGSVYGLVGGNGAGKTTLIRHILGLLRPQLGTVQVLGLDPCLDPARVLAGIGYLSEDRDLPNWMRVDQLINYTRAFYPDWDQAYAEDLLQTFGLPTGQAVKSLSRGQLARLGLLLALAHRPQLLVLDEPSSGLDPVVRRDILAAVIRTVADEGRTVLFSSHLLDEVERVSDRVCMLHQGRVVLDETLDDVKERYRRLVIRTQAATTQAPELPDAVATGGSDREWSYLCPHGTDRARQSATQRGFEILQDSVPTLDEVFVGCSSGKT